MTAVRGYRPGIVTISVLGTPAAVETALQEICGVVDVAQVSDPVTPHKGSRLVRVELAAHVLIPRTDAETT